MNENTFDQIERSDSLVDRVLERVVDAIVTGRLHPGDKLIEVQVAEQLGVSRGPVREAIRRLEQMGLVEKIPYRGAFVSQLTRRDIEELQSVRGALEGLAARILAERRDPSVISALEALLDEMRKAADDADGSQIIELDTQFHNTLVAAADHHLLNEIWETVNVQLRRFLFLRRQRLYATLDQAAQIHEPIVQAIVEGNPEHAEAGVREHIKAASEILRGSDDILPDGNGPEEK